MPKVIREGVLKKQSRPKKVMGFTAPQIWQERYFVLKSDGLWFYHSKPALVDPSPKRGLSPLDSPLSSPLVHVLEGEENKGQLSFNSRREKFIDLNKAVVTGLQGLKISINTNSMERTYLLQASTQEEWEKWLDALVDVCEHNSIGLSDFDVLQRVGEGGFGKVYKVRWKTDQNIYAMKVIDKGALTTVHDLENVLHEVHSMQLLQHPFIVRLYCSFQTQDKLVMIMSFLGGGEVYTLLQRHRFPEEVVRIHAAQLTLAIDFLHRNGFTHRDIKPENALLDDHGNILLTDFGLSVEGIRRVPQARGGGKLLISGSQDYMAPELLQPGDNKSEIEITPAVDWWALGCVLYALLTQSHPFGGPDGCVTTDTIINKEPKLQSPYVSEKMREVISNMLQKNPRNRPQSLDDIKKYKQFVDLNWDGVYNGTVIPTLDGEPWRPFSDCPKFDPTAIEHGIALDPPITRVPSTQIENFSFTSGIMLSREREGSRDRDREGSRDSDHRASR